MKITILTIGTRGDVQPMVALGAGLRTAGHEVKVATHLNYEKLVRSYELDYAPVVGNVNEVMQSDEVRAVLNKGGNPFRLFSEMRKAALPLVEDAINEKWAACQGTELIVASALSVYMGFFIAQKLDVPWVMASVNPAGETTEFHNLIFARYPDWMPFGRKTYNWLSHVMVSQLVWKTQRPTMSEAWEKIFGDTLPKKEPLKASFKEKEPLLLYGYSPAALPKPAEWADFMHVTGYWFLPEKDTDWQPSDELLSFIETGETPLYVGFGSMNDPKQSDLYKTVLQALEATKQRAVLLCKPEEIEGIELGEHVFPIDYAPFDWLFPKMKAVLHHGGVGTIALGLKAGVPNIVVSFISDQRFWSEHLHRTGVMPKPIPRKKVTLEALTTAINEAVYNQELRQKAIEIGERVSAENGVDNAVVAIENYMKNNG